MSHIACSFLCFVTLFATSFGGGGRGARESGRVGLQHLPEYLFLGYLFGTLGSVGSVLLYALPWLYFIGILFVVSAAAAFSSFKFMATLPAPVGRFS